MKRRKGLLDEEKFLPPLPEQLPRGVSSLPGYGQTSPVAQGLLGFTGRNPTYSVMDPQAQQMSDAYRLGEQASVASQLYGSVLPFAAASTMARVNSLPGLAVTKPIPNKASQSAGETVEEFLLAKYPNVDISVYGKDKIHLGKIVVPKDQRNKGLGTQIMNDLVQQADEIGATVTLSPASDFGGSKERLKDFYKRFGFVQNTGRNKDFSIRESMYRIPKEKVSPETPQNEADLLAGIGTVGAGLLSPAVLEYFRRRDEEGM